MGGKPIDASLQERVESAVSAVVDRLAMKVFETVELPRTTDDQARNARTRHAGGRLLVSGCVAPAAVAILEVLKIGPGELPDLRTHGNAAFTGRIQAEEGILGIGVIAGLSPLRCISPVS